MTYRKPSNSSGKSSRPSKGKGTGGSGGGYGSTGYRPATSLSAGDANSISDANDGQKPPTDAKPISQHKQLAGM